VRTYDGVRTSFVVCAAGVFDSPRPSPYFGRPLSVTRRRNPDRGGRGQPPPAGRPRRSTEPFARPGQYRLADDVARRVELGHPWVFRDAFGGRAVAEPTGALVELYGYNRVFLARGFVDQEHPVAVRVLSRDPEERVHPGAGAIAARFKRASQLRWLVMGPDRPTAMRLFSGDSEGLPGVNVDRYGDFVVVQWLTGGALPWQGELYDAIEETIRPKGLYEQRRLRPLGGQAPPEPAVRARGEEAPLEIVVEEAGCKFAVDVTAPLGVGFYPDLRRGRDAIAARAADRRVLNLFSYTGAFSIRAAHAGAREVVSVDSVAKVHARARRNAELSGIAPGRIEELTLDAAKALDRLAADKRRFDIVVCDPPTFSHAQGASGPFSVTRDLGQLGAACLEVLEPGGLLAFSTNSSKLSPADVERALAEAGARARSHLLVLERLGLPPDYPVAPGFPEGNYLKFYLAVK
jgi:23S rRNA (cytosine1962-C5)-methyltransferase